MVLVIVMVNALMRTCRIMKATMQCSVLVVCVLIPSTATAQAQQDTARPFVEGGVYDRPFLTRLLGRTAVGGYAEAHARWGRVDGVTNEAGFVPKRFNLFTATQVSDVVRVGAELEFEEGTEEIHLEYAAIDVILHPALTLRGGMVLSPLGRFNLAHDSPLNPFTDRPLVSLEILGVALSEPGLGLLGQWGLGGESRITWEVYAVNGFHAGLLEDSPEGTRIARGRGGIEDENRSPAVVGRVTWSPSLAFEVGLSGHRGAYNVFESDGATVDERRNLTIGVIDFDARVAGIGVSGEAAIARVDLPQSLAGTHASRQAGGFVDIVREFGHGRLPGLPDSRFVLKARVDWVDFDTQLPGDDVRQIGAGINFQPTQDTALKFDYVRGRTHDRFSNPSDHAALLFSLATYF